MKIRHFKLLVKFFQLSSNQLKYFFYCFSAVREEHEGWMQMPWSFGLLWVENMLAIGCSISSGKLKLYHNSWCYFIWIYQKSTFDPNLIFYTNFLDRADIERQIWQCSWSSSEEKTWKKDVAASVWEIQTSYRHRSSLP